VSRSGYTEEWDSGVAMWRGVIASATRGKRGQRFFRDLVAALDAMPVKRLIAGALETDGEACALGSLARAKGETLDPGDTYDYDKLGATFDIAHQLAQEVMWENDEGGPYGGETPEQRWERVRRWAECQIRKET
jgi:hypothetical protein